MVQLSLTLLYRLSSQYALDQVELFLSKPISLEILDQALPEDQIGLNKLLVEINCQLNAYQDQYEILYRIFLVGNDREQAEADCLWNQIGEQIELLSERRRRIISKLD